MKKSFSILAVVAGVLCTSATMLADEKEKKVEPFDRGIGLSTSCFIPKGTVGAGISFSYNTSSLGQGENDAGYSALFSLIQDVRGNMMSFGVSPFVSYFLKDNLAIGVRFNYDRATLGLDNAQLSIMEDMNFSIQGFRYFKQNYTGSVTLRNYIPFGQSKRFAMFTELRATGGYGQAKTYKTVENEKYGTYQDIYKFELGLVPGVAAFLTNEVALEISVGLLGIDYQKVIQKTNQVEVSELEQSGANFRVNLLSINFGLSFYIPTGDHRVKKNKADKE